VQATFELFVPHRALRSTNPASVISGLTPRRLPWTDVKQPVTVDEPDLLPYTEAKRSTLHLNMEQVRACYALPRSHCIQTRIRITLKFAA
jgi:hypothetical protein